MLNRGAGAGGSSPQTPRASLPYGQRSYPAKSSRLDRRQPTSKLKLASLGLTFSHGLVVTWSWTTLLDPNSVKYHIDMVSAQLHLQMPWRNHWPHFSSTEPSTYIKIHKITCLDPSCKRNNISGTLPWDIEIFNATFPDVSFRFGILLNRIVLGNRTLISRSI